MVTQLQKNQIKELCKNDKDVELCYLFGSVAKKKETKLSDIDIGILLSKHLSKQQLYKKNLTVLHALMGILHSNKIDFIVMNNASASLNFEIIKDGIVIYAKNEHKRVSFEVEIMATYLDRKHYDEFHSKKFIDYLTKRLNYGRKAEN